MICKDVDASWECISLIFELNMTFLSFQVGLMFVSAAVRTFIERVSAI